MNKKIIFAITIVVLVLVGAGGVGGYYIWQQKQIKTYIRWNVSEGTLSKEDEKAIKKVIYEKFSTPEGREYVRYLKNSNWYEVVEKLPIDEEKGIVWPALHLYDMATNQPPQVGGGGDFLIRKINGKWKLSDECEKEYLEWLPLCEKIFIEDLASKGIKATSEDFQEFLEFSYYPCEGSFKRK